VCVLVLSLAYGEKHAATLRRGHVSSHGRHKNQKHIYIGDTIIAFVKDATPNS